MGGIERDKKWGDRKRENGEKWRDKKRERRRVGEIERRKLEEKSKTKMKVASSEFVDYFVTINGNISVKMHERQRSETLVAHSRSKECLDTFEATE